MFVFFIILNFGLYYAQKLSLFVLNNKEHISLGTNTRIRLKFSLLGDLFIGYNHNIKKIRKNIWQYDYSQFIIKLSYGFWS